MGVGRGEDDGAVALDGSDGRHLGARQGDGLGEGGIAGHGGGGEVGLLGGGSHEWEGGKDREDGGGELHFVLCSEKIDSALFLPFCS